MGLTALPKNATPALGLVGHNSSATHIGSSNTGHVVGLHNIKSSGVAIAGSAGSMNPGPRPLGAPDDNGNKLPSSSVAPYRNNVRQAVSTSHSCKTQVQRDR